MNHHPHTGGDGDPIRGAQYSATRFGKRDSASPSPAQDTSQFQLLVKALEGNINLLESQQAELRGVLARLEGDNETGTLSTVKEPSAGVVPRLSECIDYQRTLLDGTAEFLERLKRLI